MRVAAWHPSQLIGSLPRVMPQAAEGGLTEQSLLGVDRQGKRGKRRAQVAI
jgi:hypothetical protein